MREGVHVYSSPDGHSIVQAQLASLYNNVYMTLSSLMSIYYYAP